MLLFCLKIHAGAVTKIWQNTMMINRQGLHGLSNEISESGDRFC